VIGDHGKASVEQASVTKLSIRDIVIAAQNVYSRAASCSLKRTNTIVHDGGSVFGVYVCMLTGSEVRDGYLTSRDRALSTFPADRSRPGGTGSRNNLDGTPAAIRLLPDIARAVGDQVEMLMDGGVCLGGDVVKALALGARAVMIGRAYLWGLGANGQAGVENVLDLMRSGIDACLLRLGG
jgi:hypothetical protein